MTNNNMSPFSRYRAGYEDGYRGQDSIMPSDNDYLRGFEEGKEDDRNGLPHKYDDEPPVSALSVKLLIREGSK